MPKRLPKRLDVSDLKWKIELQNARDRKRYVAFIDILGFTHLIARTQQDRKLLKKLTEALEITFLTSNLPDFLRSIVVQEPLEWSFTTQLQKSGKPAKPESIKNAFSTQRGLAFSDTVVLATGPTFNNLYNLLGNSASLALQLLNIGTFARGAI